ncbi:mismatch-specific DNA-glycosylase [Cryobacterium roopkundense]|uniref:TDG/mug DNA glycosylase family protein n=1 Tax=Cryobacterium roopkundense TaxID=1001240 RepID=A0A7W9E6L0_9MICO|nr:mismatch-specific DNA-glycosylase [Cryobacterium roopkundense]MBB5643165.1 TDG/mug DNA glycosylase family protein [Cryobacterium roopkundense]
MHTGSAAPSGEASLFVLPDILEPNLRVVFCGTAVSDESAARGHYYSKPSNSFWQLLHLAGFTPRQLRPDEDQSLPEFGIGMTDLVKEVAQSHDRNLNYSGARSVTTHIEAAAPIWVAFNGNRAGGEAAKVLGHRKPRGLGVATFMIGRSNVFILPSSSSANRGLGGLDGRATRVE